MVVVVGGALVDGAAGGTVVVVVEVGMVDTVDGTGGAVPRVRKVTSLV
jgi:hypothetical protein